jgi:uncharacterized protein YjbJ (UPF0337 family)
MNKHQLKGAMKEVAGKAQKNLGDLTDNGSQEAKGMAKEIAGKAEKTAGNAKESLKDSADRSSSSTRSRDRM